MDTNDKVFFFLKRSYKWQSPRPLSQSYKFPKTGVQCTWEIKGAHHTHVISLKNEYDLLFKLLHV